MSINLVAILLILFVLGWVVVSYAFLRINRQNKKEKKTQAIQPAFRLADQWAMESQRKIEAMMEDAQQSLGVAQQELLELRLEAGRLSQGVKNLQTIRSLLAGSAHVAFMEQSLAQIAGLYLDPVDYQMEESSFIYFKTDMGLVPVLEVSSLEGISDLNMKNWMNRLSTHANPTLGGVLYFANETHFETCQENSLWMEALRKFRVMVLDFKGLTALLMSLKLYHETNRLMEVFRSGIESTFPLVGQADKMGQALTSLGASTLSLQLILDGGKPRLPIGKMDEKGDG